MTAVSPVASQAAPPEAPATLAAPKSIERPEPSPSACAPSDALAMMLQAMEQISRSSLAHTAGRLEHAQQKLDHRLEEFLEKVKQALEAARRAAEENEDDDGGFFGDMVDVVADAVGDVFGTVADFVKDAAEQPFEVVVGLAKNCDDPGAMLNVLKQQLFELGQNGETAESVKGFTKGVLKFEAKLVEFSTKLQIALVQSGGDVGAAWQNVKAEARELWKSFQRNILDNPSFWEVTGALAKAAAVAGAVLSGGTLAWIAVGLFVLCEADQRTGFVQEAVGEKAAFWVHLGMQVGAAALLGYAAAGSDAPAFLKYFQAGAAMLGGVKQVNDGIRAWQEGDRRADELRHTADVQEALARMHQMQRMIDDLLELYAERSEDRRAKLELGAHLAQTSAAAEAATVLRA